MRYLFIALIASQLLIAQNDSITQLDEEWKRGGNATFLFNQSSKVFCGLRCPCYVVF